MDGGTESWFDLKYNKDYFCISTKLNAVDK